MTLLARHWHESATGVHVSPIPKPRPSSSSSHPSGGPSALVLSATASCIELGLVIYFTYGKIHVSVLFSQIIPPSPSPTESKSLLFTSVSLLLSRIYHYHLSKFHIYALVYCIGVFLSYFTLYNSLQFHPPH